jgi:hypothetical protein
VPVFKVANKVWLEANDMAMDWLMKKLDDLRLGPYEILKKVGASAWKLTLLEMHGHHPVSNESLLLPYVKPLAHRRDEQPAPQIIRGEEEYKVEEIINHRKCGQGYQYLVKWKNYPLNEHMWEPAQHLIPRARKIFDKISSRA